MIWRMVGRLPGPNVDCQSNVPLPQHNLLEVGLKSKHAEGVPMLAKIAVLFALFVLREDTAL